jgi:hypothetical protein
MICTLTARRLQPGAYDAFRAAWDPGDAPPEVIGRWKRVYHVRDVNDPDVVISFGFFDGTLDELRAIQGEPGGEQPADRVAPHVREVLLDGSYEVVEELDPADFGA